MPKAKLGALTMSFSVAVVKLVKALHQANETVVRDKLGQSAVAIGAHVRAAEFAKTPAERGAIYQQAFKEIAETGYYLEILHKSGYLAEDVHRKLTASLASIRALLISVISSGASKGATPVS